MHPFSVCLQTGSERSSPDLFWPAFLAFSFLSFSVSLLFFFYFSDVVVCFFLYYYYYYFGCFGASLPRKCAKNELNDFRRRVPLKHAVGTGDYFRLIYFVGIFICICAHIDVGLDFEIPLRLAFVPLYLFHFPEFFFIWMWYKKRSHMYSIQGCTYKFM